MSIFILVDVNFPSVLDSKAWNCLDPVSLLEAEKRAHKTPSLHPKKNSSRTLYPTREQAIPALISLLWLGMLPGEGDSVLQQKLCSLGAGPCSSPAEPDMGI